MISWNYSLSPHAEWLPSSYETVPRGLLWPRVRTQAFTATGPVQIPCQGTKTLQEAAEPACGPRAARPGPQAPCPGLQPSSPADLLCPAPPEVKTSDNTMLSATGSTTHHDFVLEMLESGHQRGEVRHGASSTLPHM